MGVVSFVCCLLAMDLLIHASAFQLGVRKSGIKLLWEREPLNPVFTKRARLIQPPVYVPVLTVPEQTVDIPRVETEGQIRWSRKTSLIPWPIAQDRALARALEAWRIILTDNLQGSMVGRQIGEALAGDPQSQSVEDHFRRTLWQINLDFKGQVVVAVDLWSMEERFDSRCSNFSNGGIAGIHLCA